MINDSDSTQLAYFANAVVNFPHMYTKIVAITREYETVGVKRALDLLHDIVVGREVTQPVLAGAAAELIAGGDEAGKVLAHQLWASLACANK